MLLIRCFQILLKARKLFPWEVQFSVDQQSTLAHTLAFSPNLSGEVGIPLRGNFSLCGNSVFILFMSSKRLDDVMNLLT